MTCNLTNRCIDLLSNVAKGKQTIITKIYHMPDIAEVTYL